MSGPDEFYPEWFENPPPLRSYRSIFKWGVPDKYKHPNKRLYKMMKELLSMSDEEFKIPRKLGLEQVSYDVPVKLAPEQILKFREILGPENVKTDDYSLCCQETGRGKIYRSIPQGGSPGLRHYYRYPGMCCKLGTVGTGLSRRRRVL